MGYFPFVAASSGGGVQTVTAGDSSINIGGTTANPTIETDTLNTIAANHTTDGNVGMNGFKLTGLANGSASTDSAAFGQIPTALPPNGSAGGDLSGSYPDPVVTLINGSAPSGQYARGNGTALAMSAIQAADLPAGTTSAQGALQLDGTAGDIQPTSNAAAAGSKGQAADAKHVHVQIFANVLGNGSDGAVVLDGTTTYNNFSSLAGSVYTLTRDVFASSLTINNGVTLTLRSGNYRIFCTGTVTINSGGTISNNGPSASGSTAGTSGGSAITVGNRAGGNGGTGVSGAGGAGGSSNFGFAGGAGGAGTSGAAGSAGTITGVAGSSTLTSVFSNPFPMLAGAIGWAAAVSAISVASGGGGGGSDASSNAGGGGGAGGGVVPILTGALVNNGLISATGGNGAAGTAGNAGGGGGGGGGLVVVFTLSAVTGSGSVSVTAGSLGSGSGSGSAGSTGTAGLYLHNVLA